jgi:hypothetical protein
MPLRLERQLPIQRIELIVTASEGPVWSGQHLAHNVQRQNAPVHSTHYSTITIEGKKFFLLAATMLVRVCTRDIHHL